MQNNTIGAVIIGGDFQSLGIIRSIAENNIPIFLIENEFSISRFSKYVKRRIFNKKITDESILVEFLIALASRENLNGWVLFPNNDEFLKIISKNKDILTQYYKVPYPDWEIIQKFYFKEIAYKIADDLNIPIPKQFKFNNLDEAINSELKFPLVIKPMYKKTRKKAYRADNIDSFSKTYKNIAAVMGDGNIVVQELIQGGSKILYSYATYFDGERAVCGITVNRLRQHPSDFGTTTYAESVDIPELEVMTIKLLKEIGFKGVAEVEFMKDETDNKYKFIEINGRIFGWHVMLKGVGINLPLLLYKTALGESINVKTLSQKVKWIRLITDIPISIKLIISGRLKIRDYLSSLKGKKEFAVFDLKDPLPFIVEWFMIPYLWIKRGF